MLVTQNVGGSAEHLLLQRQRIALRAISHWGRHCDTAAAAGYAAAADPAAAAVGFAGAGAPAGGAGAAGHT